MLIDAPMALASMSGRTAFTTSSREIRSAGTESIDTPRVPNSAGVPIIWPIDRDVVQAGIDAAHDDEAALALVDLHRHPGHAAQGLGRVGIRETADRIGGHHVHDGRRGSFLVARQRRRPRSPTPIR